MNDPTTSLTPSELVQLAKEHRRTLFLWTVAGALLTLVAVLVAPRNWSAYQGLLIRGDAAGYANQRLGKFTDLSEMKTVQETLLELAKSQSVVKAVLEEVGPSEPQSVYDSLVASFRWSTGAASWPTDQHVVDFRDQLSFAPPGGAEFGKTEVFYIGVLDPDRARAAALVDAMSHQLEARLQELRNTRAEGLVQEVAHSVGIAKAELDNSVARLTAFEQEIGADLAELRNMTSPIGGQSEFGQRALAIEAELRLARKEIQGKQALLAELRSAVEDPERLASTPDALLVGQPGLRRLKAGLVEAQLGVARIGGARTAQHPFVQAARHVQEKTMEELKTELPTAIASVELDLEVSARREQELAEQIDALRGRTAELASHRTEYAELTASVEARTQVLSVALKQLTDAESHQAGASSTSLLSRIDGVESSIRPVGPSRKVVVAAGALAGLLLGVTVVLLFSAEPQSSVVTRRFRHVERHTPAPRPLDVSWGLEGEKPAAKDTVRGVTL